jgi:hypothetical protein
MFHGLGRRGGDVYLSTLLCVTHAVYRYAYKILKYINIKIFLCTLTEEGGVGTA